MIVWTKEQSVSVCTKVNSYVQTNKLVKISSSELIYLFNKAQKDLNLPQRNLNLTQINKLFERVNVPSFYKKRLGTTRHCLWASSGDTLLK